MALSHRSPNSEDARGFTLIEVIVSLAVLAIILVPLTAAFITSLQRTDDVQNRVGASADAQRIAAAWTKDVHNVEAGGYRPLDSSCPAPDATATSPLDQPLVTFEWDTAPTAIDGTTGTVVPKKASWVIEGTGAQSKLVRRYCENDAPVSADLIAETFWKSGETAPLIHAPSPRLGGIDPYQFCTTTDCTIIVSGQFDYSLTVDRRVTGLAPPAASTPPPPVINGAIGRNNALTVQWSPSVVPEGIPPVDKYKVIVTSQPNGGIVSSFESADGTTLSAELTGLSNGSDYWIQAQAHNANGWGILGPPYGPVTPTPVVPGAPTAVTAVRGDAQVTASWSDPVDNGGSGITSWKIRARNADTAEVLGLVEVTGGGTHSGTVTGLPNGANITVTVSALNAIGEGPESAASEPVVPCGLPGQPPKPTANNAGDQKSKVDYQLPEENGCKILRYRVYSNPAWTGTDPSPWYTALADVPAPGDPELPPPTTFTTPALAATAYRFQVAAINEVGEGPLSPLSDELDVDAVPLVAPGNVAWEPKWFGPGTNPGDPDQVGGRVSWIPIPNTPEFNGGSNIFQYVARIYNASGSLVEEKEVVGANSFFFDTGVLTQTSGTPPNEDYRLFRITVTAENENGEGPEAEIIDARAGGRPLTSPANPVFTGYSASATEALIRANWDVVEDIPANNGGRNITGYRVQYTPNANDSSSGNEVVGLNNNEATMANFTPNGSYTLKVASRNASGLSIPPVSTALRAPSLLSQPSNTTLTMGRPAGTVGNKLTLTFSPFTDNPLNPTPTYNGSCNVPAEPALPALSFPGLTPGTNTLETAQLTNGKAYRCTVTASMTFPSGVNSTVSQSTNNTATPYTTPTAPGSPAVVAASSGKAKVTWTAPASNGGSALTGYTVSVSPALAGFPATVGAGALEYTSSGPLAFGTTYTFSVVANNAAGSSPVATAAPYTPSNSLPTAAPTNLVSTPVYDNQIKLDWTPVPNTQPSNGGSALTGQTITLSPAPTTGSATVTVGAGVSTYTYTTNQTSTGNVVAYTATVAAVNANGTGPQASVGAKAGGAPLAVPANFRIEPFNSSGIVLAKWDPVPNTTPSNGGRSLWGVKIYVYSGGSLVNTEPVQGTGNSQHGIGGLTPGTAYTFKIVSNNDPAGAAAGDSAMSTSIIATAPGNPTVSTATLSRAPANVYGTVILKFQPFTVNAGSPAMTDYSASCKAATGATFTKTGLAPGVDITFDGLPQFQTDYTCTVTGRNFFANSNTYGTATLTNIGPAATR